MTHEIRCIECGWLDPKLWTNQEECNCTHYFQRGGSTHPSTGSPPASRQFVFDCRGRSRGPFSRND